LPYQEITIRQRLAQFAILDSKIQDLAQIKCTFLDLIYFKNKELARSDPGVPFTFLDLIYFKNKELARSDPGVPLRLAYANSGATRTIPAMSLTA
jgi:hypothetical protein